MNAFLKHVIIILTTQLCFNGYAQDDNVWDSSPELNISGFADVYYAYDFNKPTVLKASE